MAIITAKKLFNDFLSIIYPHCCAACEDAYALEGDHFCLRCRTKISNTDHFENEENELLIRLAGRVETQHGAALFKFIKEGIIQEVVHKIKYKGRDDLIYSFGQQFGAKLLSSDLFKPIDLILPIPVHRSRLRKRGFNQSEVFSQGISDIIKRPVESDCLRKTNKSNSQTKKSRVDRFQNVLESFELCKPEKLQNKAILLVDDVLTTGATIEAAFKILNSVSGLTIQIGILALAHE